MRARSASLVLVLLATLAALGAPAQGTDNTAPLAAARAFDEAQQHRDRTALERLIAPDFLIVHGSGKVGDRRDLIDGLTKPGVTLDPFAITDRLFLRVAADVAIAGGEARITGTEDAGASPSISATPIRSRCARASGWRSTRR